MAWATTRALGEPPTAKLGGSGTPREQDRCGVRHEEDGYGTIHGSRHGLRSGGSTMVGTLSPKSSDDGGCPEEAVEHVSRRLGFDSIRRCAGGGSRSGPC
jgi:hypothetical protein